MDMAGLETLISASRADSGVTSTAAEAIHWGTVVEDGTTDSGLVVHLDGEGEGTLVYPSDSLTYAREGDRVQLRIRDTRATIMGTANNQPLADLDAKVVDVEATLEQVNESFSEQIKQAQDDLKDEATRWAADKAEMQAALAEKVTAEEARSYATGLSDSERERITSEINAAKEAAITTATADAVKQAGDNATSALSSERAATIERINAAKAAAVSEATSTPVPLGNLTTGGTLSSAVAQMLGENKTLQEMFASEQDYWWGNYTPWPQQEADWWTFTGDYELTPEEELGLILRERPAGSASIADTKWQGVQPGATLSWQLGYYLLGSEWAGRIRFVVQWRDAGGVVTTVSTHYPALATSNKVLGVATGVAAVDASGTVVVPETAVECRWRIIKYSTTSSVADNAVQVYRMEVRRQVSASDILAGAVGTAQLADKAVSAGKIAANAVTSNAVAANAIVAGKIAAGAVSASMIASDTAGFNDAIIENLVSSNAFVDNMLASQIVVEPTEYAPDPYYKPDWWTYEGGAKEIAVTTAATNQGMAFYDKDGVEYKAIGKSRPVTGGTKLAWQINVRKTNANCAGLFVLAIRTVDKSGAEDYETLVKLESNAATSYKKYSGVCTVPSDAISCQVVAMAYGGGSSYAWYTYGLSVKAQTSAVLIENGAVTADKIAAGAITADKLKAGVITTDLIEAGTGSFKNAVIEGLIANSTFAQSLRTSQLLVEPTDLMPEPGKVPGFWTMNGNDVKRADGKAAIVYSASNTASVHYGYVYYFYPAKDNVERSVDGQMTAINPGYSYAWQIQLGNNNSGNTRTIRVDVEEYNNKKVLTATQTVGTFASTVGSGVKTGVYSPTNANVAYVRVRVVCLAGTDEVGNRCWWNCFMRPQASAVMIKDGAVTAAKVAANAITAEKIKAGSITATHINANKIAAADLLTVGATTSGNGVSVYADGVRIVKSGKGIVLNGTDGLVAGDVSSTSKASLWLDMQGNATFKGTVAASTISGSTITGGTISGAAISASSNKTTMTLDSDGFGIAGSNKSVGLRIGESSQTSNGKGYGYGDIMWLDTDGNATAVIQSYFMKAFSWNGQQVTNPVSGQCLAISATRNPGKDVYDKLSEYTSALELTHLGTRLSYNGKTVISWAQYPAHSPYTIFGYSFNDASMSKLQMLGQLSDAKFNKLLNLVA